MCTVFVVIVGESDPEVMCMVGVVDVTTPEEL